MKVSLMPMTEVAVAPNSPKADLMSFASPVSSSATQSPRRSTRRSWNDVVRKALTNVS